MLGNGHDTSLDTPLIINSIRRSTSVGRGSFLCWGRTAIAAGREWLADCAWRNVDSDGILDEEETSAADVIKNVRKSYDGGIYGFFRDGLIGIQD